jgi:hypothetical protein
MSLEIAVARDQPQAARGDEQRQLLRKNLPQVERGMPGVPLGLGRPEPVDLADLGEGVVSRCLLEGNRSTRCPFQALDEVPLVRIAVEDRMLGTKASKTSRPSGTRCSRTELKKPAKSSAVWR